MLVSVMGQERTSSGVKVLCKLFSFVSPLTKVYSNVTKVIKTESKIVRDRRSLWNELFISLDDRTLIEKKFASKPNIPTIGCN